MSIRDIIVLTFFACSLPVCFFKPVYGIALWTLMSFLNPQDFTWGIARETSLAFAVAVPTIAGTFIFSPNFRRLLSREAILIGILWLWFTATSLNSAQDPLFADKAALCWFRWNMVSKILLMTGLTIVVIDTWQRLRWLVLAIAAAFGFLVLHTLPIMILSGGASRVYGPDNSMIADNNDFGLALNMVLPLFFFLAKTEDNRWIRRTMWVLFLGTIPAIFFTYSRGALLGLIVVLVCMALQSKQKLILIPMAVVALLFAVLFTPQAWKDRMSTDNALDASALSRINAWSYSWAMTVEHPIMGGGFEAFTPALFQRYAPNARDVHGPHSIYFGVLAEHGFTGLSLYLCLIALCLAELWGIARRSRRSFDERAASYADMFRFSLVGFLVSGAFLGRAYFDLYFSLVACVSILSMLCASGSLETGEETAQLEESYGPEFGVLEEERI
jgi:probable O-glycosylation ligase (exosortase A-associated)